MSISEATSNGIPLCKTLYFNPSSYHTATLVLPSGDARRTVSAAAYTNTHNMHPNPVNIAFFMIPIYFIQNKDKHFIR